MMSPNADPHAPPVGRSRLSILLALLGALAFLAALVWAAAPHETPPAAWAPREPQARAKWLP